MPPEGSPTKHRTRIRLRGISQKRLHEPTKAIRERTGSMSYYKRHVFFCCNQREAPEACCANYGSVALRAYAKGRIKALGLDGQGKVRMNTSGCLDRCEEGPVMVVYPDAVWYTYIDRSDIDEIIDRHILKGEIVERLRI